MPTTFMSLVLPAVGVTTGPTWAQNLNDALTLVDSHDHSVGKGTPVTPAGLNINQDLPFNNNNLGSIRQTRFMNQGVALSAAADNGGFFRNGDDIFWRDGAGNNVRITSGGNVDTSGSGNITGMGATTAAVTYSNATKTFTFTQDANFPAKLDCGDLTFHETVLNGNGITFKAPVGLAAPYTVTWPASTPPEARLMLMQAGGTVTTADDPTIPSRPTFEGINPGNTADVTAGNIRFDGTDVQARVGGAWHSVTGQDGSSAAGVQVGYAFTRPTTFSSFAGANIPNDDTIPQITEGAEWATLVYTPKRIGNKLLIETAVQIAIDTTIAAANGGAVALFMDAVADALAANVAWLPASSDNLPRIVTVGHEMTVTGLAAITFRVRVGRAGSAVGTTQINGFTGTGRFGVAKGSYIKIVEIAQ